MRRLFALLPVAGLLVLCAPASVAAAGDGGTVAPDASGGTGFGQALRNAVAVYPPESFSELAVRDL